MKDPVPWRRTGTVIFCTCGSTALVGLGFLYEVPGSHSDKPHSARFLWTSDQLVAETSTWQHTTLTTDKHALPQRVANPLSQQASVLDPTPFTAATLEPEPTKQRKPFVCAYIARHVWLLLIRHVCLDLQLQKDFSFSVCLL
jgi:hypothetical protein